MAEYRCPECGGDEFIADGVEYMTYSIEIREFEGGKYVDYSSSDSYDGEMRSFRCNDCDHEIATNANDFIKAVTISKLLHPKLNKDVHLSNMR
jgi:Zn finger protein HypA/HybF involved in hydrogenase expression